MFVWGRVLTCRCRRSCSGSCLFKQVLLVSSAPFLVLIPSFDEMLEYAMKAIACGYSFHIYIFFLLLAYFITMSLKLPHYCAFNYCKVKVRLNWSCVKSQLLLSFSWCCEELLFFSPRWVSFIQWLSLGNIKDGFASVHCHVVELITTAESLLCLYIPCCNLVCLLWMKSPLPALLCLRFQTIEMNIHHIVTRFS